MKTGKKELSLRAKRGNPEKIQDSKLMQQLLLPFNTPLIYTRASWVTGACNQEAMQWVDSWSKDTPFLCVYGEEGSGKTHLAHIWQEKTKALYWDAQILEISSPYEMIGCARAIALDNADLLVKDHSEWLFHLYNCAKEKKMSLLLTAKTPPTQWQTPLSDLKSRLSTLVSVELGQPNDALLTDIIKKQFSERGLRTSAETIDYLLKHIERSFTAIKVWVDKLDYHAAVSHRTVTIPLVRGLLGEEI